MKRRRQTSGADNAPLLSLNQFDWGTEGALTNTLTYGTVGSGLSGVNASKLLPGLVCNTTYQVRARAVNSKGTTPGAVQPFTTQTCPGC